MKIYLTLCFFCVIPFLGIAQTKGLSGSEEQIQRFKRKSRSVQSTERKGDAPILWMNDNYTPYNPFRDKNIFERKELTKEEPVSRGFLNLFPPKTSTQNQELSVVTERVKRNFIKEKRLTIGLNFARFSGDFETVADFESRRNTQFSLEYVREMLRGGKGWATLTGFAVQGMGGRFVSTDPTSSEETKFRLWYLEFMPIGVSKRFKTDFGSPMVFLGCKIRGLIGGSYLSSGSLEREKISIGFEEKDFETVFFPVDSAISLGFAWKYENYFASIEGNFGLLPVYLSSFLPDLSNRFLGIRLGYVFGNQK